MATFAQMRTPLRINFRCSGVHVAGGQTGESSGRFPSFSLLVSFMLPSRSGRSLAAGLSLQVGGCAAGRGRMGRAPGGVYAGQSLKKVIWNPSPMRMLRPPGIRLAYL